MDTHYIPYFTRSNGPKEQAICGRYVRVYEVAPTGHAPTCPECLTYVESAPQREKEFEDTIAADPELAAYFPR